MNKTSDTRALAYIKSLVTDYVAKGLGIREISRLFDAYVADIRINLQQQNVAQEMIDARVGRANALIDQVLHQAFLYQLGPIPTQFNKL